MSVLWMDDPSFYQTAQWSIRYESTANLPTPIPQTSGRFGNPAWSNGSNINMVFRKTVPGGSLATGTVAVSAFLGNSTQSAGVIMALLDSGTAQIELRTDGSGHLNVTRNGSAISGLAASSSVLSSNTWYRIEMKATINATTGSIEVRVNGATVIGPTGSLNTKNATNASFSQVSIQGHSNSATFYNDLVITDTNSPNADFLGDKRCFLRSPSSDSSVTWTPTFAAWAASTVMAVGQQIQDSNNNIQRVQSVSSDAKTGTPSHPTWATTGGLTTTDNHVVWVVVGTGANPGVHNWMAVSELPEDGDNSYNADSTPNDVDLFGMPNLPAGAANVSAVDNIIICRKDDAGTRTIQGEVSSSGTVANTASLGLGTSYVFLDQIMDQDPNGPTAWTVTTANNLLIGYKEIA